MLSAMNRLTNISVNLRLLLIALIAVLGVAVTAILVWQNEKATMLADHKTRTRHLVEVAHGVLNYYYGLAKSGLMTEESARGSALAAVKAMRYDKAEYFWIHDLAAPLPNMVMHPTVPHLDGKVLDDAKFNCATSMQEGVDGPITHTDGRKNLFVAANEVVTQAGHGFITYNWPKPLEGGGVTQDSFKKLSYVKKHDGWNWVIGSGVYLDDVGAAFYKYAVWLFGTVSVVALLIGLGLATVIRSITRPLRELDRTIAAMRPTYNVAGISAKDEICRIGQSLDQMLSSFHETMKALAHAAQAISAGNWDARAHVEGRGELDLFAASFNHMATSIEQAKAALVAEKERFRITLLSIGDAVISTDTEGRVESMNPVAEQLTGWSNAEAQGRPLTEVFNIVDEVTRAPVANPVEQALREGSVVTLSDHTLLISRDGSERPIADSAAPIRSVEGILGAVVVFRDQTRERQYLARLEQLAHYDTLTHLPNRALLIDRLRVTLARARRTNELVAVCVLDLDGFKPVNDRYGHAAGDRLLIGFANRLKENLREDDTAARLGGDEFVLLLCGLKSIQECQPVLQRLLQATTRPYTIDCDQQVHISASIGVTFYPLDDVDPDTLLRHADRAMYAAKEGGRNRYCMFDSDEARRPRLSKSVCR